MRYDIAFTFPGQGSQRPGMGAPWIGHPAWSVVADITEATGVDVAHLLLEADADELRDTANAQLAVFALGMVVFEAVRDAGVKAMAVAGHSLGEYGALVASRALTLADASRIVKARGEAMRSAAGSRTGTMAAVLGVDDSDVEVACASVDGDVWPANFNTPGQVVIGGDPGAVALAGVFAEQYGARSVVELDVSGAFHTPMMAPALPSLREALASAAWTDSDVPVVANVDGMHRVVSEAWKRLLAAQLVSPVRWTRSIETLAVLGCGMFVEMGAKTLTPMMRRILKGADSIAIIEPDDLIDLVEKASGPTPNAPLLTAKGVEPSFPDPHEFPADLVVEGEMPDVKNRMIVAQSRGVFEPEHGIGPGTRIEAGQVIGWISGTAVASLFTGIIDQVMAFPGERMKPYQAVAWLSPT